MTRTRSPNWKLKDLSVDAIVVSRDFQPRETALHEATVRDYARDIDAGDPFGPIEVAKIKGKHFVISGFHRLEATKRLGRQTILARVATMTERQALSIALRANVTHGRKISHKDKRRHFALYCDAGLHLRPNGTVKSLRDISEELRGVICHQSVSNYLRERGITPSKDSDSYEGGEEDDLEHEPYVSELEDAERVAEVVELLHRARTICDGMSQREALEPLRAELRDLLDHVEREIDGKPVRSALDI